jgi:hypothetical protein
MSAKMPVLAQKQHHIAYLQSKLQGTHVKVWVRRGNPEKVSLALIPAKLQKNGK